MLKIKLGRKTILDDRRNYLARTLQCDWFRCVPMTVTLPGDDKVAPVFIVVCTTIIEWDRHNETEIKIESPVV